jgi:hypothetical protein
MVQNTLKASGVNLRVLAEDADVNYGTLRQWAVGHRVPMASSLSQVAAGLRKRAGRLEELAEELEKAAGEE